MPRATAIHLLTLNHHVAPVALRERAAVSGDAQAASLRQIAALDGVDECVLLSTCNRTEIVLLGSQPDAARAWFAQHAGREAATMCAHHVGQAAVRHCFRVAAGLDSMVLGEPQILGQVKQAVAGAHAAGTLGPTLDRLFQAAFSAAKSARSQTDIGANPVSFAFAGVRLAERIFDDLSQQSALLVGAGDMIELFARHLKRRGVRRLMFANRTVSRAEALAHAHGGAAMRLESVADYLADADVLVTSTGSATPIISAQALRAALKARHRKPMCVLDLAVPRDVDPAAAKLGDAYVYSVDALKAVIESSQQARQDAAQDAEALIDEHVAKFGQWLVSRRSAATIRTLRADAAAKADPLLVRALARLEDGDDPQSVLQSFARLLGNTLLHPPTTALRRADASTQRDLLAAVEQLYGLAAPANDDSDPDQP